MKKLLSVGILMLVAVPAFADWCALAAEAHGHSVSANTMCMIEMLFKWEGGW